MADHEPYDPEVYKRLELVRKQFERNAADLKKQQKAEKRRELVDWLAQHKQSIVRLGVYVFLGILVVTIIGFTISEVFTRR